MRLTLKGVVVALKLRPELLQDFLVDTIIDKSNPSPLAKAIFCFQALWFCVQCLERVIQIVRVIIVVGCLIALFNSVPGAFEEPSWSAYFLHIN